MKNKKNNKQFISSYLIIFSIVMMLQYGFVYANSDDEDTVTELTEEEIKEQEEKEDEYKDKTKKYEKKVKKEEKKKAVLQGELGSVNNTLGATKRTINDVSTDIEKKEDEIKRHSAQIEAYNKQVDLYKTSLSDTLRRFYFISNNKAIVAVVENNGTERFLQHTDSLGKMRTKIVTVVAQVENAKQAQQQKKDELSKLKVEKEKLLAEHKKKESALLSQSSAVKAQIGQVDKSISELNAKLANIESKLSALLGESFNTGDITKAAKFASKKTGVRKDFILGMLVVETDLGRFTGGCTYKKSNMNDYRKDIFKDICKDLGYNYKKQKVSCPPANYKGTGGAMGVAQFMSDTWKGYESKIASATGHNPPDPWSLTDGVMAMALKLANDGATKKSGEWKAASRYLGTCSTPNTKFYCENVLWWADNYEKKL